MVLRQSAEGRGQKLNVLHSIEKRYNVALALSISSHRRSDRCIFPQSAICCKQQRFAIATQLGLPLTSHSW